MGNRVFLITVRGKQHEWCFEFEQDEQFWLEWLDDGLDVRMVENMGPGWVVDLGLTKIWCALQDFFGLRWL